MSVFGDHIGALQVFGLDLDANKYPARYATFAAIVFFLLWRCSWPRCAAARWVGG